MSALEDLYLLHVRAAGLPEPEREYHPFPDTQHRVDFYWRTKRLVVEIEGGNWIRGRHNTGGGFEKDCRKYNRLAMMGYTLLRFTGGMVESGEAVQVTKEALG